jgi:phage nucleotide-binding protein
MKITSTKVEHLNTVKALVFGQSGAGKTTLAGTLPGKTLIISAESGLLTLRGKDIDVIDITCNDEGATLNAEGKFQKVRDALAFVNTPHAIATYQNIFIDSLSEIQQVCFEMIRGKLKPGGADKTDWPVYKEALAIMRPLIKKFRDLQTYSVVFTCLNKVEDDEEKSRHTGLLLSGLLQYEAPAYFDEVFYLAILKDSSRLLVCQPTDKVLAKDRSGKLSKTEPADLGKVFSKILADDVAEAQKPNGEPQGAFQTADLRPISVIQANHPKPVMTP